MNHIIINKTSDCCGCGACVQKCPVQCIQLIYDEEGFVYPHVDDNSCINCNQCNKVCPLQKEIRVGNEPSCYIAYNMSQDILRDSSSGGVFWLLVQNVLAHKGVVYGAVAEGFDVFHKRGVSLEECASFRKSKYLQSDTKETYKEALSDLRSGKTVLYSGTPCQIAGLYSFVGNSYKNLITCEVICHGVPSRAAFNKWLEELAIKHKGEKPISVVWRDKSYGWGPNRITYTFENGEKDTTISKDNLFQYGFLRNLYLRPSCYECKFAKIPRTADISLADAWGYSGLLKKRNENQGLSIVLISSEVGEKIFNTIKNSLVLEQTDIEYVKALSRHVWKKPLTNNKRSQFFSMLKKKSFERSANRCLEISKLERLKSLLVRIKLIITKKIHD